MLLSLQERSCSLKDGFSPMFVFFLLRVTCMHFFLRLPHTALKNLVEAVSRKMLSFHADLFLRAKHIPLFLGLPHTLLKHVRKAVS